MAAATSRANPSSAAIAAAPVSTAGVAVPVTASLGLALAAGSMQPDDLIRAADLALYAAKHGWRNRVAVAGDRAAKLVA